MVIIEPVIAVGGQMITTPVWDEFDHKSGRLENPDTQEDYSSKGEGTPAIREMKVEQKGRERREKCFLTFLLQGAERLCASLSCLINTHIMSRMAGTPPYRSWRNDTFFVCVLEFFG